MTKKWLMQTGKCVLLLALCLALGCAAPLGSLNAITAQAADSTIDDVSGGKWKTTNKKVYYIKSNGKKAKGLVEIDGKKYYFDSKGVQRTGWQKIKADGETCYYYFKIANKAKGYMVTDKTVNGITLKKSGKASTKSKSSTKTQKLKIMVMANEVVEKATKPTMTKKEKLKATWNYVLKNYTYRGSPKFDKKNNHWDQTYALSFFKNKKGACYHFGAAFAYLGNACGYTKCYAVSSGGHGWALINNKVYDPTWALTDKKHNYFGRSLDSTSKGVPNYKKSAYYKIKI